MHAVHPAISVHQALAFLALNRTAVLILDPSLLSESNIDLLTTAISRDGIPVLIYTAFVHARLRSVLDIVRTINCEILFSDLEDDATLLMRLLESTDCTSPCMLMLRQLAPELRHLPAALAHETAGLFGWRRMPSSVGTFCNATDMSARRVGRWLQRIGVRSPSLLLSCARLARTWHGIYDPRDTSEKSAALGGFETVRNMTDHHRRVVGISYRYARETLTANEFARLLSAVLQSERR